MAVARHTPPPDSLDRLRVRCNTEAYAKHMLGTLIVQVALQFAHNLHNHATRSFTTLGGLPMMPRRMPSSVSRVALRSFISPRA